MTQRDVRENTELQRFELYRDHELVGFATYQVQGNTLVVPHVETFPEHRGQGFAGSLMEGILAILRVDGRRITPVCPFAASHIQANPHHHDLVSAG